MSESAFRTFRSSETVEIGRGEAHGDEACADVKCCSKLAGGISLPTYEGFGRSRFQIRRDRVTGSTAH